MSPRETANKWLPGLTLIISIVFFAISLYKSDTQAIELELGKKASKDELKDAIDQVKRETNIQNEWIIKTLDKMDKRTERIEEKLSK